MTRRKTLIIRIFYIFEYIDLNIKPITGALLIDYLTSLHRSQGLATRDVFF